MVRQWPVHMSSAGHVKPKWKQTDKATSIEMRSGVQNPETATVFKYL